MDWKKIGKAILFPHIAIMIILLPIATVFLVYSLVFMGSDSIIAIVSYVLAFYTLMIWILKVPYLIQFFKNFKDGNKYARRWQDDDRLRVNVSLYLLSPYWQAPSGMAAARPVCRAGRWNRTKRSPVRPPPRLSRSPRIRRRPYRKILPPEACPLQRHR